MVSNGLCRHCVDTLIPTNQNIFSCFIRFVIRQVVKKLQDMSCHDLAAAAVSKKLFLWPNFHSFNLPACESFKVSICLACNCHGCVCSWLFHLGLDMKCVSMSILIKKNGDKPLKARHNWKTFHAKTTFQVLERQQNTLLIQYFLVQWVFRKRNKLPGQNTDFVCLFSENGV